MKTHIDENLVELDKEIERMNLILDDEEEDLTGDELDLSIENNADALVFLLLRIVDKMDVNIWYKIAFAIVVKFIRKLTDKG